MTILVSYRKSAHWESSFFPLWQHLDHHCSAAPSSSDRRGSSDRRSLVSACRKKAKKRIAETQRGCSYAFILQHRLKHFMMLSSPSLPADHKFDDVGENSIKHQSQSHSWTTRRNRLMKKTRQLKKLAVLFFFWKRIIQKPCICVCVLPKEASFRSPCSDLVNTVKTRIIIRGVKTATLWKRQKLKN